MTCLLIIWVSTKLFSYTRDILMNIMNLAFLLYAPHDEDLALAPAYLL